MFEKFLVILLTAPVSFVMVWGVWMFTHSYAAKIAVIDPAAAIVAVVVGLIAIATVVRDFLMGITK